VFSSTTPPQPAPGVDTVLCPRCDAGFQCGANTGACWCAQVMLDDKIRDDLAGFYKGCLCRSCLQMLEDVRPPKASVVQFLKQQLRRSH
jgi:hypothetical protein